MDPGLIQGGFDQAGSVQVGTNEVGLIEDGFTQSGSLNTGFTQVGPTEGGGHEFTAIQTGLKKNGSDIGAIIGAGVLSAFETGLASGMIDAFVTPQGVAGLLAGWKISVVHLQPPREPGRLRPRFRLHRREIQRAVSGDTLCGHTLAVRAALR